MHTTSAAVLKEQYPPRSDHKPRLGTKLREAYDLFYADKGKTVPFKITEANYYIMQQLQNTYGLDIRRIKKGQWVLVGEWFGKTYVDYFLDRFDEELEKMKQLELENRRKNSVLIKAKNRSKK